MKKLLFILTVTTLLSITGINVQAQERPSLQATSDWIFSKFGTYFDEMQRPDERAVGTRYSKPTFSNFTLTIKIDTIILSYSYDYPHNTLSSGFNGGFAAIIPIHDIKEYKNGYIITNIASITMRTWGTRTDGAKFDDTWETSNYYYTTFENKVELYFDTSREENLEERLEKAFENLKYYYPKPKSNEAF